MSQRAKMSVAAQFKAIGQSKHPLGLSAFKTRSGVPPSKTQKITQKIIHNYEQVILSLSNEQKKDRDNSQSPDPIRENQDANSSPVKDFTDIILEDKNATGLKLANSESKIG